jgi:predicted tellurium resistance membrane protein TerC
VALEGGTLPPVREGFVRALLTIVVADVTMSLDNVLAVGALAHGNIPVLVGGLLLSVALLLVGSALVAELIGRVPWLLDLAALVLAWTAAHMILSDTRAQPLLSQTLYPEIWLPAALIAIVLVADIWLRARAARRVNNTKSR